VRLAFFAGVVWERLLGTAKNSDPPGARDDRATPKWSADVTLDGGPQGSPPFSFV